MFYEDYPYIIIGHKKDEHRCITYVVEPILGVSRVDSRDNSKVIKSHVNKDVVLAMT